MKMLLSSNFRSRIKSERLIRIKKQLCKQAYVVLGKTQILHYWLKIIMGVKEIAAASILKAGLFVSTWRI
jgi:hypothetical protein